MGRNEYWQCSWLVQNKSLKASVWKVCINWGSYWNCVKMGGGVTYFFVIACFHTVTICTCCNLRSRTLGEHWEGFCNSKGERRWMLWWGIQKNWCWSCEHKHSDIAVVKGKLRGEVEVHIKSDERSWTAGRKESAPWYHSNSWFRRTYMDTDRKKVKTDKEGTVSLPYWIATYFSCEIISLVYSYFF